MQEQLPHRSYVCNGGGTSARTSCRSRCSEGTSLKTNRGYRARAAALSSNAKQANCQHLDPDCAYEGNRATLEAKSRQIHYLRCRVRAIGADGQLSVRIRKGIQQGELT